jgi:perosamine synthetase
MKDLLRRLAEVTDSDPTVARLRYSAAEMEGQPVGQRSVLRPRIPLSNVDLTELEFSYVRAALADGWISGTGPFVSRFEEALCARTGRTHTVATANGTLAIELALRALDVGPGDEVIVPALTFAAPAMSVLAVGGTVVLADVSEESWTLAIDEVAQRITPRTRAIIAVDVLGHPADYDELASFGIPIIEDAAEAHGARYKGKPAGSRGDIAIFSFHANKAISTGEGGCACTGSDELADRMRTIANHGMRPEKPYIHQEIGRNFRMTGLTAAIGIGQVERWDALVDARNKVSQRYDMLIDPSVAAPRPVAGWAEYACWLHTVTVDDRASVLSRLRAEGVDARAIWPALPDQPVFKAAVGSRDEYPVARWVSRKAMWLPTYSGLEGADAEFVADLVQLPATEAEAV